MGKALKNGGEWVAAVDEGDVLLFGLGGAEEEGVDFIGRRPVVADVGDETIGAVDARFEKESG